VANAGIEWLVRLAIEPRRLWRRYVIGLPVFGMRLLANWGRDPLAAWRARSILARQG
jgi:UDP-N-acetyl-D-mannosaminuronic acid transferase (WecB/TagA/CpsF family)